MKKRFFAVFSLILAAVFLVACSSQSTGEKNWEKIEKRGSIKVATAGTLYPQTYHDDKNNLTGHGRISKAKRQPVLQVQST